ncbi:MAG: hypothetical protein CVU56_19225 [Deltaproteobacteria bacterium HGW-Deltaproteobacteria-14]|jgi:hypothetical protein|nr:MAG: hypothetical protein CVU56_19225 [Deltaproteobacteria bacterium HGW-Deltaproteobacteria-14]
MDWYLTWQDPVALALVVLSILLSRWLAKRVQRSGGGCASCPSHALAAPTPKPLTPGASGTHISLDRLRISR